MDIPDSKSGRMNQELNLQKESATDSRLLDIDPTLLSGGEMDFSLLASNMQKFLHISGSNKNEYEPPKKLFKGSVLDKSSINASKGKLRNYCDLEDITVNKCPFCSATFNAKYLLARHALRIHHKAVVNLLLDGSTQQHLKCHFCVHKVMHRHQKLLLLHLEKKHAAEFVSFLRQVCVPSPEVPEASDCKVTYEPAAELVNLGFQDMTLSSNVNDSQTNPNSGLNVMIPRNEDVKCFPSNNTSKFNHFVGGESELQSEDSFAFFRVKMHDHLTNHSYAKRKLILDGSSDHSHSKTFLMKENIPPKESLTTTLANTAWQRASGKHFSCGRCKQAFSCNALLLDHVSVRHRGPLRLLQPIYTCGLCSASFYKNSFLVRHCYQHHTPK